MSWLHESGAMGVNTALNLYVPRPLVAFSYRSMVQTKKEEWIEVKIPLDKFQATSFGSIVEGAESVDPKQINGFGFLLGDKQAGPFLLEVAWIKVLREEADRNVQAADHNAGQ